METPGARKRSGAATTLSLHRLGICLGLGIPMPFSVIKGKRHNGPAKVGILRSGTHTRRCWWKKRDRLAADPRQRSRVTVGLTLARLVWIQNRPEWTGTRDTKATEPAQTAGCQSGRWGDEKVSISARCSGGGIYTGVTVPAPTGKVALDRTFTKTNASPERRTIPLTSTKRRRTRTLKPNIGCPQRSKGRRHRRHIRTG